MKKSSVINLTLTYLNLMFFFKDIQTNSVSRKKLFSTLSQPVLPLFNNQFQIYLKKNLTNNQKLIKKNDYLSTKTNNKFETSSNSFSSQLLPQQTIWRPYYILPRKKFIPRQQPIPFNLIQNQENLHNIYPLSNRVPISAPFDYYNPSLNLNYDSGQFTPLLIENNLPFNPKEETFIPPDQINLNQAQFDLNGFDELEKDQIFNEKTINDKIKLNQNNFNDSQAHLLELFNEQEDQFNNENSNFNINPSSFIKEQNTLFKKPVSNSNNFGPSDPNLFINGIEQFTNKTRTEEKTIFFNETSKIMDTNPQQYIPPNFKNNFQQMQFQKKNDIQLKQFAPFKSNNKKKSDSQLLQNDSHLLENKKNLDQIKPQLSPYVSSQLFKQQQYQNSILNRLNNQNPLEATRRINTFIQERNFKDSNKINSNFIPEMNASKNSNDLFIRRSNTQRYVIISIVLAILIAISVGIIGVYVKQRKIKDQTHHSQTIDTSSSAYGTRRFYQRRSSQPVSDSVSYGPTYFGRSTSVKTSSTGPKLTTGIRRGNIITHR